MFDETFEIIKLAFKILIGLVIVFVPLGIWKLIDLIGA